MSDRTDRPDDDNPSFDFSKARHRQDSDPSSSEAARLRRALREIERAPDVDTAHDLARQALSSTG